MTMMGRQGTTGTIGAMHVSTGLMVLAMGRAMQDGIQRAQDLAAVDAAHVVGHRYYVKRLAQRKAVVRAEATDAMAKLIAHRKRIHG